jgi:hypothetical protein
MVIESNKVRDVMSDPGDLGTNEDFKLLASGCYGLACETVFRVSNFPAKRVRLAHELKTFKIDEPWDLIKYNEFSKLYLEEVTHSGMSDEFEEKLRTAARAILSDSKFKFKFKSDSIIRAISDKIYEVLLEKMISLS